MIQTTRNRAVFYDRPHGLNIPNPNITGAVAAFSTRKIAANYAGSAIRVRRSSDNAEANIGFSGSGDLDIDALLAHVGTGDGFITTWYDQSGNGYNAAQATAAKQPVIVTAGVLNLMNTRAAMAFSGAQTLQLSNNTLVSSVGWFSVIAIWKSGNTGAVQTAFGAATGITTIRFGLCKNASNFEALQGRRLDADSFQEVASSASPGTGPVLSSVVADYANSDGYVYRNGSVVGSSMAFQTSGVTSGGTSSRIDIGSFRDAGQYLTGAISEMIMHNNPILDASLRYSIERNLGAYYGIPIAL